MSFISTNAFSPKSEASELSSVLRESHQFGPKVLTHAFNAFVILIEGLKEPTDSSANPDLGDSLPPFQRHLGAPTLQNSDLGTATMSSAVADLEAGLAAMLHLKPPGVSTSRIKNLTELCQNNVKVCVCHLTGMFLAVLLANSVASG